MGARSFAPLVAMTQIGEHKLRAPEKAVLWCIAWHRHDDMGPPPLSIGRIATETCLGLRTVKDAIATLRGIGALDSSGAEGRVQRWIVTVAADPSDRTRGVVHGAVAAPQRAGAAPIGAGAAPHGAGAALSEGEPEDDGGQSAGAAPDSAPAAPSGAGAAPVREPHQCESRTAKVREPHRVVREPHRQSAGAAPPIRDIGYKGEAGGWQAPGAGAPPATAAGQPAEPDPEGNGRPPPGERPRRPLVLTLPGLRMHCLIPDTERADWQWLLDTMDHDRLGDAIARCRQERLRKGLPRRVCWSDLSEFLEDERMALKRQAAGGTHG